MQVELHHDAFLAGIENDFGAALEDAADDAGALPGSPSDLHAVRTGPMSGRIGSDRRYARAQELGAFIRPRGRRALKFASGRFSKHARLRGQHYLAKTARRWGDILLPRLRR
jgi:hypothetical protein